MAFGLASAEYLLGLERFFPRNAVTELIYISKDLVGHTQYRIPASFPNAHAYGGTMVMGLPLLIGAVIQKPKATRTLVARAGRRTALLGRINVGCAHTLSRRGRLNDCGDVFFAFEDWFLFGWLILLVE